MQQSNPQALKDDQTQGMQILGRISTCLFPGDRLFELHATNGLPLGDAINKIMVVENHDVSWDLFIEQARKNKRWDFQIIDMLETGLTDACVYKDEVNAILQRTKLYMLKNPL